MDSPSFELDGSSSEVKPLRGLAAWVGGKSRMAARLAARIEAIPHQCYAEPFVGMESVFFARRHKAMAEAVNDKNGELINLFRIARKHPEALLDALRWTVPSREELARCCNENPANLTDIERAARFFYIMRHNYRGQPEDGLFRTPTPKCSPSISLTNLKTRLDEYRLRLARASIECLDYDKFIQVYDRDYTLFYCDPPYWGYEDMYGKDMFARSDFENLARILGGIKGKFLLSLNDLPEVREVFKAFKIEEIETDYRLGTGANGGQAKKNATELLITNT